MQKARTEVVDTMKVGCFMRQENRPYTSELAGQCTMSVRGFLIRICFHCPISKILLSVSNTVDQLAEINLKKYNPAPISLVAVLPVL